MINLPQDSNIDTRILERMLDENLSASYKLYWFSGMFKEIINGNQFISFRRIVCRMIATAWYALITYHLNLGINDKLYDAVILIHRKYNIDSNVKEEDLISFLDSLKDMEVEKKITDFYKFVPYRLISPFFSNELSGLPDSKRNRIITELSQSRENVLYKIDVINKMITINKEWFDYIYKNQNIVYGWMNYKLVYYLQKRNPNVPAIPFKLNAPYKRDLSQAKKFWTEVKKSSNITDIYTDKAFDIENLKMHGELSIDHFIPWSFVLHDELWNLVPTFKQVNSSKSNKLPELDLYIDKFCDLQYDAFSIIRNNKTFTSYLEDYLTINKKMNIGSLINGNISKGEFVNSIKSTIIPLFQIAYNQGYDLWHIDVS